LKKTTPQLGLGLLSIGRAWGLKTMPPPKAVAVGLIEHAFRNGIRVFDTAPAYNTSEAILGEVLASNPGISRDCFIATKVGEHWIGSDSTCVDHTYDALCRSIDRRLEILGRIDLLQIHKADSEVVGLVDVERAISYALDLGVREIGASISSEFGARTAITTGLFDWLQFPINQKTPIWHSVLSQMTVKGMRVMANRPFVMGAAVVDGGNVARETAFRHVTGCGLPPGSVILTGTSSEKHLDQNICSYRRIVG